MMNTLSPNWGIRFWSCLCSGYWRSVPQLTKINSVLPSRIRLSSTFFFFVIYPPLAINYWYQLSPRDDSIQGTRMGRKKSKHGKVTLSANGYIRFSIPLPTSSSSSSPAILPTKRIISRIVEISIKLKWIKKTSAFHSMITKVYLHSVERGRTCRDSGARNLFTFYFNRGNRSGGGNRRRRRRTEWMDIDSLSGIKPTRDPLYFYSKRNETKRNEESR